MVEDTGRRVCDQEIWSRKLKLWVGCRKPAQYIIPTKWHPFGLDFCSNHADLRCQGWVKIDALEVAL